MVALLLLKWYFLDFFERGGKNKFGRFWRIESSVYVRRMTKGRRAICACSVGKPWIYVGLQ